jgi:hypothetical protein
VSKRGVCVALLVLGWSFDATAAINISQNPFNAGTELIGNTTPYADATLSSTNNVTVDLVIVSSSCSGGGGTFEFADATDLNLNSPRTISVRYTPSARGTRTCRVDVEEDGSSNVLGSFNITGRGEQAQTMSVSGTTNFGSTRFNNAAPSHTTQTTFTVSNTGDRTLTVSSVTITGTNPGDWSIVSGGTSGTVAGGGTRNWTIQFDPSAAGNRSATLTFNGDDPNNASDSFTLSGVGTTGVISVTTPLDYGIVNAGGSAPLDVPIANIGAMPRGTLSVTTATITDPNGWITFSGCGGGTSCTFNLPGPLQIAANAVVSVRCRPPPNATAGAVTNASVTFNSDTDSGTAHTAALRCTAGVSDLATNANTVMFAPQLVTTTTMANMVTITNNGNIPATFYLQETGTTQNQFELGGTTCGLTGTLNQCSIAAAGTATFTVTFTPGGEGDISAGVNIVPTPGSPVQLTLVGRGIDRHIEMAQLTQFPDTYSNPGTRLSKETIKIKNTGEYPLHVSSVALDGAPNWALDAELGEFDVPPLGEVDVIVRFTPVSPGKAPDGVLAVVSDDRNNMLRNMILLGNGKERNVSFAPGIDFGNTGAGLEVSYAAVKQPNEWLNVVNMDVEPFELTGITSDAPDVFKVQLVNGDAIEPMELPPATPKQFDVVFMPPDVGEYTGILTLHLDGAGQRTVEARGNALFVDARGGGGFGCSTGHGASSGLVFALLWLRRKRRRA